MEQDNLFTDVAEFGQGSADALVKTLMAGVGADAAQFTGGRALMPESCETTLVNVMREMQDDFKLMNTIKKTPVHSTVHQFNIRDDVGDADMGFVPEGGVTPTNLQSIKRQVVEMAFIQKLGAITQQLLQATTFEDALEVEKVAVTLSVLKTAEKYCFHGDKLVVPRQYDGFPALIKNTDANLRNVYDIRGRTIGQEGEGIFTRMAEMIYDRGGEANKVFYPIILGSDIQDLARDRFRFNTADFSMGTVFNEYPTIYGTLKIAREAGPNKLYFPKNKVKQTDSKNAPNRPASVALAREANAAGSQFLAADAGMIHYLVHAVNEYGISEGTEATSSVAAAAGDAIRITITPSAVNPGTGFIISRTRAGQPVETAMEMVRIPAGTGATTVYVDKNEDLPGTAEMLFITEKRIAPIAEFYQLSPMQMFRMPPPSDRLIVPFIMALWGAPNLKAPHWCGLVKNIGYAGGLYG